jgi:hypothetical protein
MELQQLRAGGGGGGANELHPVQGDGGSGGGGKVEIQLSNGSLHLVQQILVVEVEANSGNASSSPNNQGRVLAVAELYIIRYKYQ